jgi:PAS domain S-box-containing protein
MSTGIGLAFGPGIITIAVPNIIGFSVPGSLGLSISLIALPLLPIFYTYAIYKRQLGKLEFRANRLISLYSFILIYPTIFLLLLLFGEQWITSPAGRTFYLLLVSMAFVLATPSLLKRFQGLLNRLAYGTHHDPDDILRVFAKQIPAALSSQEIVRLVTKEFMPSLLIRQSALWILENNKLKLVYAQRVPNDQVPENESDLRHLEERAGLYIPPNESIAYHLDWVRLAIPLVTREETIGIWLFGRRDPDDFYAKNDIDLLQALTNQFAPVMENIRLYEELQQHADNLADEVARRTSELRSEKDRTQAILDSAGEGIFFTDPVGVILYANPAMAMLSGYRAEELIGHTLDLWQTEEDSTDAYRQMWTAIYNGRDWGGELLLRRKDSSYVDVSLAVAPIQSHDGQLTGFVGVQSDISKLKEVDRLKSNIISSVSHELKTPLTTIKTYLMLLDRGRPEKRDGYITVLNRETERLTNIIVDLLDLSTLDTGKIPSRLEPISVQTVVEEVIASCVTRANAKEITMNSKVVGSIPRALADNNQMEQVLTNLLVNAINYTPLGGQVTVTAGSGELDGELAVWVRVTDTGSGIAPEDLPHLFDRFYRGRAATESSSPGTGLLGTEHLQRNNRSAQWQT